MAHGEAALVVAPGAALLRLEQRLVRLAVVISSNVERVMNRAGRRGLVTAQRHRETPSKNSIFWPAASVTMALRQGEVQPLIRPRFVPRHFSLGLVVRTLTATTVTFSFAQSSSTAALIWILFAVSWTANVYLPRLALVHRLLADDRAEDHFV